MDDRQLSAIVHRPSSIVHRLAKPPAFCYNARTYSTKEEYRMQVNLDENEVTALLDALNSYIPQLREEIGKTENYDMREDLKAQEAALTGLVAKLGGSVSGGSNLGASNPPWGGH
jgi:hypothetical protein